MELIKVKICEWFETNIVILPVHGKLVSGNFYWRKFKVLPEIFLSELSYTPDTFVRFR